MPRYIVCVHESTRRTYSIEADSADEARSLAEQTDDLDRDYDLLHEDCEDWSVESVQCALPGGGE